MAKFYREFSILFISAIFLFFLHCQDSPDNVSPEGKDALEEAMTWLNKIDEGRYAESWQMTSASIKNRTTEKQWIIGMEQIRAPMGAVTKRKIISVKPGKTITKETQQRNVIAQFSTTFKDQNSVTEFVTLQLENNQEWLVSAYYIDR